MRKGPSAAAFARRLRALMIEKGYTSTTNRAGVDLGALARAAHVSLEMARRYAEGLALPRTENLPLIAQWLDVDPATLLWGTGSGAALNEDLLEKCLTAVLEAQRMAGASLDPSTIASMTAQIYSDTASGRGAMSAHALTRLMRALLPPPRKD